MADETAKSLQTSFEQVAQANDNTPQSAPLPAEKSVTSKHRIAINGEEVAYKATVGSMIIKNDDGEAIGEIHYTAYKRTNVPAGKTQPVSFVYNGGPGSSSAWLHMGAFGPRQVETTDGGFTPPAPYSTKDNPHSLLDQTDLVFIDPVGTGFSRAIGVGEDKDFWGVNQDIASLRQFVARYINQNNLWNTPKFLMGESYGTFRSALLANALYQEENIAMNGIVLLSSVLDFNTLRFQRADDSSYMLYLPSYAATAYYHGLVKDAPKDLDTFIAQAKEFALGEYNTALLKGSDLTDAERQAMAEKLSHFTGLSTDYLLKANLRVELSQFRAELQRNAGKVTGRLDARFSGLASDLLQSSAYGDPQSDAVSPAFTAAFNHYMRTELGYNPDQKYEVLSYKANGAWDWKQQSAGWPGAPNATDELVQVMTANPLMKVQIENGIYDLATPFFATEHTIKHLGLPKELQGNISQNYYKAGHMMYLRQEDAEKLKKDISAFIQSAAPQAVVKAEPKKAKKPAPKR